MGANFQTTVLTGTRPEVQKFNEVVDQCKWESGHGGYSGTFAEAAGSIEFREHKEFATAREAEDYVIDIQQKWSPPVAVKLKTEPGQPQKWFLGAWCAE